nr:glycosyltransferase [FCB group bacterium]
MRKNKGYSVNRLPKSRLNLEFSNIFSTVPPARPGAPKYLFAAPRGLDYDLGFMGIITHRLRMENIEPHFLLCDNLPVCSMRDHSNAASEVCDLCMSRCVDFLQFNGFSYNSIWEYLNAGDVEEAREVSETVTLDNFTSIKWNGYDIGVMQEIAVARYFFKGGIESSDFGLQTAKHFIYSAILLTKAYERSFKEIKPAKIILSNGKTNWASQAMKVAADYGIDFVNYENASPVAGCGRGNEFQFSKEGPMVDFRYVESWKKWKDDPLTEEEDKALDRYLQSRKSGSRYYPTAPKDTIAEIEQELGIELKSPVITLYSNVVWDTSVLQKNTIFDNMFEWIKATIREAEGKPYTLLIRVHPAETVIDGFESRQKVTDEIKRYFPVLPENVRIIPPDSKISSYTLISVSDFSLVYTSTIGVESVIAGKPALVCGMPHYGWRGFTVEPETREQYLDYLRNPEKIPAATKELSDYARRYIYMFTFRNLIPLKFFGTKNLWVTSHYTIGDIKEIMPGANPYFDVVMKAITGDGDFTIPRELDYFEINRSLRIQETLPVLERSREFTARLDLITQRLQLNPNDSGAQQDLQVLNGDFMPAVNDNGMMEGLYQQTQYHYQRGDLDSAIESMEKIFELNPNHPGCLVTMAKIYIDSLRVNDAEPMLLRACHANPQDNECWRWLTNVYKIKSDKGKEIGYTQIWLNHMPDSIPALLQASSLVLKEGEVGDLIAISQKIMSLGGHPTAEKILGALGYLHPEIGDDEEAEAAVIESAGILADDPVDTPEISVLLCSYNGGGKLAKFFDAMRKQNIGRDKFEIICVNDGSTDNTGELMKDALQDLPGSYQEHETNLALAAARNTAIKASKGRLVLFINDDTYPEPEMLSEHVEYHKQAGKDHLAVQGFVKFTEETGEYMLSKVIERDNLLFPLVGTVEGREYDFNHFVTANLSCHRSLFTNNDIWFNTTFDKYGCEDVELGYRLWQKGMRVMYNPRAVVRHEHLMKIDDYIRREENNNSNLVQFVEMHPELMSGLFQTPMFTEEVIAQWKNEVGQFEQQF